MGILFALYMVMKSEVVMKRFLGVILLVYVLACCYIQDTDNSEEYTSFLQ